MSGMRRDEIYETLEAHANRVGDFDEELVSSRVLCFDIEQLTALERVIQARIDSLAS